MVFNDNANILIKGNVVSKGGRVCLGLTQFTPTSFLVTQNKVHDCGDPNVPTFANGLFGGIGIRPGNNITIKNNQYENNIASYPLKSTNYVSRDIWVFEGDSNVIIEDCSG